MSEQSNNNSTPFLKRVANLEKALKMLQEEMSEIERQLEIFRKSLRG